MIDKISEKQAREMIDLIWQDATINVERFLKSWKEKDYIKKSKLEEARKYYRTIIEFDDPKYKYDLLECFKRLHNKYEQAIEDMNG